MRVVTAGKSPGDGRPCEGEFQRPMLQLHRFFKNGFTAADIAEPLVSWDSSTAAETAGKQMEDLDLDVAGIRISGAVSGWCFRGDLGEGPCIGFLRSFSKVP